MLQIIQRAQHLPVTVVSQEGFQQILLIPERHLVNDRTAVYRDEASLLDVVQTLLADPARCEAMGRAARERVLERHTYRHRADALLAELALSVKVARPGQEGYFAAFLALDMLGVALDAAARAMAATSGGKYRKIAGGAAAAVLRGLGCVLDLVERIRKH